MNGTIVGGWQYVWTAYGLTAAAFLIYGVTLLRRLRDAQKDLR
ncbi:MAG TPA: heme exporter protein CcmD [Thermoanaerobaculia bacterium]|jgi:heme exporter protein D